jgi:hypothetical protein
MVDQLHATIASAAVFTMTRRTYHSDSDKIETDGVWHRSGHGARIGWTFNPFPADSGTTQSKNAALQSQSMM